MYIKIQNQANKLLTCIKFSVCIIKPGMRGPQRTWFLEIVSSANIGMFACVCVCVHVCPPPRALITGHVKHMDNNWIKQLFRFFICHLLSIN